MEESEHSAESQMASFEEALRALGFTAKPKDRAPHGPGSKCKHVSSAERKTTEGEKGAVGLNDQAPSFASPITHLGARIQEVVQATPSWRARDQGGPLNILCPGRTA